MTWGNVTLFHERPSKKNGSALSPGLVDMPRWGPITTQGKFQLQEGEAAKKGPRRQSHRGDSN